MLLGLRLVIVNLWIKCNGLVNVIWSSPSNDLPDTYEIVLHNNFKKNKYNNFITCISFYYDYQNKKTNLYIIKNI